MNPLTDIAKLMNEPKSYWLNIFRKYVVENKYVSIQCVPSKEEQQNAAKEEKDRIDAQIATLTEEGLKQKRETLEKAVEYNEREPPIDMLTSVPIPTLKSIKFHNITQYSSQSVDTQRIDLRNTSVFTFFDHLKSNFVYVSIYIFIYFSDYIMPVVVLVKLSIFQNNCQLMSKT